MVGGFGYVILCVLLGLSGGVVVGGARVGRLSIARGYANVIWGREGRCRCCGGGRRG